MKNFMANKAWPHCQAPTSLRFSSFDQTAENSHQDAAVDDGLSGPQDLFAHQNPLTQLDNTIMRLKERLNNFIF